MGVISRRGVCGPGACHCRQRQSQRDGTAIHVLNRLGRTVCDVCSDPDGGTAAYRNVDSGRSEF